MHHAEATMSGGPLDGKIYAVPLDSHGMPNPTFKIARAPQISYLEPSEPSEKPVPIVEGMYMLKRQVSFPNRKVYVFDWMGWEDEA